MLSPHQDKEHRISFADAFPRFAAPEEPEPQDEGNAAAALIDCFWVDLKTRSKLRLKTGHA